jgi:cytochrome c5
MLKRMCLIIAACAATATVASAEEKPVTLKAGPGKEVVENNCNSCHSLDYIIINSPFLDEKRWGATVTKMIKTFGAPIEDADAKEIVGYLAKTYGAQ